MFIFIGLVLLVPSLASGFRRPSRNDEVEADKCADYSMLPIFGITCSSYFSAP